MRRFIFLVGALLLAGCNDPSKDQVIVMRGGMMKLSNVSKYGPYCYLSWYDGIDAVLMNSDGTAHDDNLNYRWEPLAYAERDNVKALWDRNKCEDQKS
jgi:hypothetical protein